MSWFCNLQNVSGLLASSLKSLYRKWGKSSLLSSLTPTLFASLITFSITFIKHFIPKDKYSGKSAFLNLSASSQIPNNSIFSDFLPTSLLEVYTEVYTSQTFSECHVAPYTLTEHLLETTSPELVAQQGRVSMMQGMIRLVTSHSAGCDVTVADLHRVFDGLEGAVHFCNDNLTSLLVRVSYLYIMSFVNQVAWNS